MIQLEISGMNTVLDRINGAGKRLRGQLLTAVKTAARRIDKQAKVNLSNRALHVRSGTLRSSIRIEIDSAKLEGIVGTNVIYAKIHEFGGTTKAHIIRPRNAKVLRFATAMSLKTKKATKYAYTMEVKHPGSKIPARPYLHPAYRSAQSEIVHDFQQALQRTLTP